MKKEDLIKLKKQIESLSEDEKKQRDIYLKNLSNGTYQGPMTGYSSVDKPWLKYYSDEAIKSDLPKMSCYELLLETANKNRKKIALNYLNKKISYDTLIKNIELVSNSLDKIGLKKGDIICISLPNIPEAAYLMYACSKLGIIANMIDPRTSTEGIKEYALESNSKYLFMIEPFIDKVESLKNDETFDKIFSISPLESLPVLKNIYNLKNINKNSDNVVQWNEFINNGKNNDVSKIKYEKGFPLLIEHTGGTTGTPKGVILSNDSVNTVALGTYYTNNNIIADNKWLNIMPTFIAYGAAIGMHLPLIIGIENVLIPQFDPNKFGDLIKKYKPNYMAGVPSHWESIIDNNKLKNQDLSFLQMPAVGGDAMNIELEKKLNEFLNNHNCDAKISKGYGMTEVCGGATGTGRDNNIFGSVGSPFYKNIIGIFNPETEEELKYDEIGEICFCSPSMMNGYLNNIKETNHVIRTHIDDEKEWVHSGDIGYLDSNGNIFIIDRIKRIIIRYDGFKVFPSLIENVINTNENVVSSKVIGIKDENHSHGFLPKAYIVFNNDNEENINIIEELCKKELPEYMQPAFLEACEELPLTSIGKIDYKLLEEANKLKLKKEIR